MVDNGYGISQGNLQYICLKHNQEEIVIITKNFY